jgi:hypothetical protein
MRKKRGGSRPSGLATNFLGREAAALLELGNAPAAADQQQQGLQAAAAGGAWHVGDAASAPAAAQPALGTPATPPADLETAFVTDLEQLLADWQQRNGTLRQQLSLEARRRIWDAAVSLFKAAGVGPGQARPGAHKPISTYSNTYAQQKLEEIAALVGGTGNLIDLAGFILQRASQAERVKFVSANRSLLLEQLEESVRQAIVDGQLTAEDALATMIECGLSQREYALLRKHCEAFPPLCKVLAAKNSLLAAREGVDIMLTSDDRRQAAIATSVLDA